MQYAPPYYYGGSNQQSPSMQQAQPQQPQQPQQQQLQHPQHPQLQMSDHQMYHHGIPAYSMNMPPHQSHPGMVQPGAEFNMMTKPKRKQVKNACVNCQKACKKCDDGRPCQRCIKYGLSETCVNSVRKERKKGVKRGPYKRRNQANGESSSPTSVTSYPNASSVPAPYYGGYEAYQGASNPMQQYVMAMQQQQAMYQNLPYQQPMPGTTSSPGLPHPQSSPATTNATAEVGPKTEPKDSSANVNDEEGSKLNILSQLCSDVLDKPPKNTNSASGHPSPAPTHVTNTSSSDPQQQHTPVLSTPISSSPSSANASPTLHKQEPQMMYPQQQQQQQQGQSGSNWQGQW